MTDKSNELIKQEEKELAKMNDFNWGVTLEARNIIIPKIMLMQGQSELVLEGKARLGDLVNSLTNTLLGGMEKAITLIPFYLQEFWYVFKVISADKEEFLRVESMNASNIDALYDAVEGGITIRRSRVMQVYFLNPANLAMPLIGSFKGKSFRIGKELYTLMYCINKQEKKFPPSYTIDLTSSKDKNDRGTFAKFKFTKGRETTLSELQECTKWIQTIQAGKAKGDESDLKKKEDTSPNTSKEQF